MPKTAIAAAVAAASFVAFVVWILSGWTHGRAFTATDDVILVVASGAAALASARTACGFHGRTRAAWSALTFGLVAYAGGQIVWAFRELVAGERPFPSLADAFFLTFPASACVALLLFRHRATRSSDWRILLDGGIVAGSLFACSWALVMSQVFHAGAASRFEFALLMAYPVWDVVLVTVACVVLVSAEPGQRFEMSLVTLGLAAMALADSGYAYLSTRGEYFSGSVVDIGWVAGLLLLAVAAVAGRHARPDQLTAEELPGWASVWVPYAPLMTAVVVVAAQPPEELASGPLLPLGVLTLVAVMVRQFLAVSENRRLVSVVAQQALHDPLTGLGNRSLFNERLGHAVEVHEGTVALIVMDINDFKLVNDSLGHPVGDELLLRAGERIAGCVRAGDTVARLGGDEFAVLIEGEVAHAEVVAHRIVEAFDRPFLVGGQELLIRPSVGLAIAVPGGPEVSGEELLRQADVAMYSAKRSRTGGVHTYNAEMQLADGPDAERLRRPPSQGSSGAAVVRLLGELRHAIEKFELTVVYQPKFDLRTGVIVGVEALVRWPHPERGLLGPEEFLPLVRRHGLMGALTDVVVNKALDDALLWHQGGFAIPVAVNLFAPSMANPELPQTISRALSERSLGAAALTVEITEDLFLENVDRTRSVLAGLRKSGIRIAIDDFGSGYSALSYLRDLPIDEVKLDREFIAPILVDTRAAAVVRAVLNLAGELGLTTVAEGIEDAATAGWLREHGCQVGQGYYYSPALSLENLLELLRSGSEKGRFDPPDVAKVEVWR
ncbi:bifunctional diguanylate cyclase/phosphodiesterase [Mycolicibacterium sp. CH28]|uniref:putative bifunctional diguanylate cyclase/phosphodiesterase n=1 Tax=Mycolicibacterium sp. CH28 TaxID=2512237 RepID=UPI001080B4DD|nr:bifunctional diguanylate cyclase/phosphodiesterase [Mycolicibacterium sp. CH28]TGD86517.1 bifunctional diguanylate cyclase/phosphodiesterase [Mycolicibacterium sp. CH28]